MIWRQLWKYLGRAGWITDTVYTALVWSIQDIFGGGCRSVMQKYDLPIVETNKVTCVPSGLSV